MRNRFSGSTAVFAIAALGARRTPNLFLGSSGTDAPYELTPGAPRTQ
jgi:hypothetical protein